MARKGENIYKRKDGRWEGRWIESRDANGKAKYRSVYGKSYKEVRLLLSERKFDNYVASSPSSKYLKDFAVDWLASVKVIHRASTYDKYSSTCKNHILPVFGNIKPERITSQQIQSFLNDKLQMGLSSSTAIGIKTVFQLLLNYAYPNTICDFKTIVIKQQWREMRILSLEEQSRLCCFLKKEMDYRKLGVYLCLFTGLRIGEICALQWKNIDLKSNTICIDATMQRVKNYSGDGAKTKIMIGKPKSKHSCRTIPISTVLANVLKFYQSDDNAYLLTGNSNYCEPRSLQYCFKLYLKQANIPDLNFHSTRHTFATRCIEAGMDVKSLSEILGHANINITISRYVHSSMDWKRENIEKLSSLM